MMGGSETPEIEEAAVTVVNPGSDLSWAEDLSAHVRRVIDDNLYMVLATAGAGGQPWPSPVFYAADEAYRELYWVSSPEVTHSRNLAQRPELGIVIFDSRVPAYTGAASSVYLAATAGEVPAGELDHGLGVYPGDPRRGARSLTRDEVQGPSPVRLYRAVVSEHFAFCPRVPGEPCAAHGNSYDHRVAVPMP
jgi:nitroimidazol reductase NimA-like FMN-containing flavoprotein (pyridoxamine 5'-phosphate oxidase superfamily)